MKTITKFEVDNMRMKIMALVVLIVAVTLVSVTAIQMSIPKDPTYATAKMFMYTDETNERQFDGATYDCHNFSVDTRYNASLDKIRCAYVLLFFEGAGPNENHAIVAFNTTDRGTIFFEPQTDGEVVCVVGDYYVMPSRSYKITGISFFWF